MVSEFTCIVCPWGCLLRAEDGKVGGYSCSRGMKYAKSEIFDPRRSISGTVRVRGAVQNVIPVKTSAPIPKELMTQAAELLRNAEVSPPINTGDVIIPDLLGTGIDFIAARSM